MRLAVRLALAGALLSNLLLPASSAHAACERCRWRMECSREECTITVDCVAGSCPFRVPHGNGCEVDPNFNCNEGPECLCA